MQIAIDIPDSLYTDIKDYEGMSMSDLYDNAHVLINSIYKGVILPKHHNDLIDKGETIKSLFDFVDGKKTIGQCIDDVPVVIKATKE